MYLNNIIKSKIINTLNVEINKKNFFEMYIKVKKSKKINESCFVHIN